jgi:ABC-type transport system involved in cytochrome c biogenesis permease subunit
MGALLTAIGSTGSAESVEELAARATGAGAPSLGAGWLSLSGAAFAVERR